MNNGNDTEIEELLRRYNSLHNKRPWVGDACVPGSDGWETLPPRYNGHQRECDVRVWDGEDWLSSHEARASLAKQLYKAKHDYKVHMRVMGAALVCLFFLCIRWAPY